MASVSVPPTTATSDAWPRQMPDGDQLRDDGVDPAPKGDTERRHVRRAGPVADDDRLPSRVDCRLGRMGALIDLDVKATVEASVGDDAVEAQLGRRLQTRLALKVTKASEIDGRAPRHVGPSSV